MKKIALLLGLSTLLLSNEADFLLDGFDETPSLESVVINEPQEEEKSPFEFNADISLKSIYSYNRDDNKLYAGDKNGLSSLEFVGLFKEKYKFDKGEVFLSLQGRYNTIYQIQGRENYPDDVLESYESELEIWESYLDYKLTKNIDLRIGRQIINWGKADLFRVTDRLNPLDMRRIGVTDIKELRLPVTMTKVDVYSGDYKIGLIGIFEQRYSKKTELGSHFHPLATSQPKEEKEGFAEDIQFALSLETTIGNGDYGIYGGRVIDDMGYLKSNAGVVQRFHDSVDFISLAINIVSGSFSYKIEAANTQGIQENFTQKKDTKNDALFGFDYMGISEMLFTLELAYSDKSYQDFKSDEKKAAFKISREFMNDQLELLAMVTALKIDAKDGGFSRVALDYDLGKGASVNGGVVTYFGNGFLPYGEMSESDSLYLNYNHSF